jgi:hypothetical protein
VDAQASADFRLVCTLGHSTSLPDNKIRMLSGRRTMIIPNGVRLVKQH